ncbi:hypothetical protein FH603_2953 [Spirosoma sp. LMG 31447]|uniref:Transposase n=1 Tax=Spirosoma utsteinense TaxID=2585773 RepID=A0ABR6W779_9BACT|nr:hypothetical protein [Spirosoma utsteinense]
MQINTLTGFIYLTEIAPGGWLAKPTGYAQETRQIFWLN